MIFNRTYQFKQVMDPLSQDEILHTPEYYAMSYQDIIAHHTCPEHLKRILLAFNWKGRPNVVQVRPQDFREGQPPILGVGWHVDCNTVLANGRNQIAKSLDEFKLFVVSFGDVVETQFLKGPVEIPDRADPFNHSRFASYINKIQDKHETIEAKPNQLVEYTSRDIHRVAPNPKIGNARIIIVAYECDEEIEKAGGRIGKTIAGSER